MVCSGSGGGGNEISFTEFGMEFINILLAFDPNHTNIQAVVQDFNAIHPNIQFTAETERDNYLDISILRTPICMKTSIYRKPTFTDTIIPHTSNQPTQHKYATVKFLYNRLNTYDLEKEEHEQELNIIHNILHNNSFPIKHQKPQIHTLAQKKPSQTQMGYLHLCR
jgi:hypothetical protein